MTRPNIHLRVDPCRPCQVQVLSDEVLPAEVAAVVNKRLSESFIGKPVTEEVINEMQVVIHQTLDDLINMRLLHQGFGDGWIFDHARFQKNEESDVEVPVAESSEC